MQSHPHFDLRLHSDEELAVRIGEPLAERVTLHEWPLSCVQRITGFSGQKWIYKAESGPTVEHLFYARASSPLLPDARTLYDRDGYVCLLIEYIDAAHFEPAGFPNRRLCRWARRSCSQSHRLKAMLPAYWVVDSAQWRQTVNGMQHLLTTLVDDGVFLHVSRDDVATVMQACKDEALVDCLTQDIGLVHGDLTAENVLVATGDGALSQADRLAICAARPVPARPGYIPGFVGHRSIATRWSANRETYAVDANPLAGRMRNKMVCCGCADLRPRYRPDVCASWRVRLAGELVSGETVDLFEPRR